MKLFESIRQSIKEADSGIEAISEKMDLIEEIYAEAGEEHETDPDVNDRVYEVIKDIISLIEYKEVSREEFDKLAHNHQAIDWSEVYEEANFAKNINGKVSEEKLYRILMGTMKEVATELENEYNINTKLEAAPDIMGGAAGSVGLIITPKFHNTKENRENMEDYKREIIAQLMDSPSGVSYTKRGVYYVLSFVVFGMPDDYEGNEVKINVDSPISTIKKQMKDVIYDAVKDIDDLTFISDITNYRVNNNITDAEEFLSEARNPKNDKINELIRRSANVKGFAEKHKEQLEKAGLKVNIKNDEVTLTGQNGRRLQTTPYYPSVEAYKKATWANDIVKSDLQEPTKPKSRGTTQNYESIPSAGTSHYKYPSRAGGYNVGSGSWERKKLKDWGKSDFEVAQRQLNRAFNKYGANSPEVEKQRKRLAKDREIMGLKKNVKKTNSYDISDDIDLLNLLNSEPSYVNKDYTPEGIKNAQNKPLSDRMERLKSAKNTLGAAEEDRKYIDKRYKEQVRREDEYLRQEQLDHDKEIARATEYRNQALNNIDKQVSKSEDDLSEIRNFIKKGNKKRK